MHNIFTTDGHISVTSYPIYFMFGSRVGFSGTADLMVCFLNKSKMTVAANSNGQFSVTGRRIHLWFGFRVGFSGTANRMVLYPVRINPRWRPPPSWRNFKWWPYLHNGSSNALFVSLQNLHLLCCCLSRSTSTCSINVLALSGVSQISAMVAFSKSQLPAANDMYG